MVYGGRQEDGEPPEGGDASQARKAVQGGSPKHAMLRGKQPFTAGHFICARPPGQRACLPGRPQPVDQAPRLSKAEHSTLAVVEDTALPEKLAQRMERSILRPHAHCTRRKLARIKQAALGKLAAATCRLKSRMPRTAESHSPLTAVSVATWNAAGLAGKESDPAECAERMELALIFACETWVKTASRAPGEELLVWSPKPRKQAGPQTTEDYGVALWARRGIDRAKLKIVRGTPGLSIW